MKKMIAFSIAVVGIAAAEASPNLFGIPLPERSRPAARRPAPPPKPHDRHDDDKALAGGILHAVGAVAGLVDHTVNGPETVVVQQPTTVVVSQPAVVPQPQTVVVAQPGVVQTTPVAVATQPTDAVDAQSTTVQPVSATTGHVVVPANNVVLRPVVSDQPVMTVATPGEPALETVYIPATYTPPPSYFVKPIVIPLHPLRPW